MLRRTLKIFASTFVLAMTALTLQASAFVLPAHQQVTISVGEGEADVVATAVSILESDLMRVLNAPMETSEHNAQILIATQNKANQRLLSRTGIDLSWLNNQTQAFVMATTAEGQLLIAGSDALGTAYGVIELTRLLGVSPWEWWADVVPAVKNELRLANGFSSYQSPDIRYRGICLSDMDWGLKVWANSTYEPGTPYYIGPKTTTRILELMLRLRLNLFWPPATEPLNAFFITDEFRSLADSYGVVVGHDSAHPLPAPLLQPLMSEDDGFGYIRHFPTEEEFQRNEGNGLFYHLSYSGSPHDYLWLATASPFLMFQQLSEAYYHGTLRLWMVDVGDIKPCEYQISLFSDMAWDIKAVEGTHVARHIEEFIAQNVARDIARLSSIYLKEHYQLSFQCKPEHLACTRVGEPADGFNNWDAVRDLPWSEKRIRHRLKRYDQMQRMVKWIADSVRRTHPSRYNAFFQLVEYPMLVTAAQNNKYLLAQLARHGKAYTGNDNVQSTWRQSDEAHNRVQSLTMHYNSLGGGKWQGIISSNPRSLTVFQPVPHKQSSMPMITDHPTIAVFYGASYNAASFSGEGVLDPVLGLGASIRAMPVPKMLNVTYKFAHNFAKAQEVEVEIHMLPTHAIEAQQRFTLSFDGSAPQTFTYDTEVGSEQWKQNVLRNYAVVIARLPITKSNGEHQLTLTALDDGVVVDEVFVRKNVSTPKEN